MGIQQQRPRLCAGLQSTCWFLTNWDLAKVEERTILLGKWDRLGKEKELGRGAELKVIAIKREKNILPEKISIHSVFLEIPELCWFCYPQKNLVVSSQKV